MLIIKVDVRSGTAEIHLTGGEISMIRKLMYEAGHQGQTRTQFYLLDELLTHGAYDNAALEIASGIMEGKKPRVKADRVCGGCKDSRWYNGQLECWGRSHSKTVNPEDSCRFWEDGETEHGEDEPGSGDPAEFAEGTNVPTKTADREGEA